MKTSTKAELLELATFIESNRKHKFDMRFHETCFIGFYARMKGWTAAERAGANSKSFAADIGMNEREAWDLCIEGRWARKDAEGAIDATRREAVDHLRRIAR